jgi:hypothetical protein
MVGERHMVTARHMVGDRHIWSQTRHGHGHQSSALSVEQTIYDCNFDGHIFLQMHNVIYKLSLTNYRSILLAMLAGNCWLQSELCKELLDEIKTSAGRGAPPPGSARIQQTPI